MIFNESDLKKLFVPQANSHKGDNGKVMIIGGSQLFHAASLWPLEIASKIVDMVFYSSVPDNNALVKKVKEEWRNGIVVPREKIDDYITEADAVLIGPGLPRKSGLEPGDDDTKELTERLLKKYPEKKWVIDGGSLQTIDPNLIPKNAILTPHHQEFEKLFGNVIASESEAIFPDGIATVADRSLAMTQYIAKKYHCVILLKGEEDIICSDTQCVKVRGGNAGMTKGGTGDVLAGLTAALYSQNDDAYLVAQIASYINKKAGDSLFKKVGYYFNATDLVQEIPVVMKQLLL
ncbi:MAG TPA: NAD(P)H-hydrate dehydratase [Patescibacteria group bacterium]|nr:NAD(P)H-hydrate dehydratase [Patescibacteria group bacterium]